jgi:hypothetical protein
MKEVKGEQIEDVFQFYGNFVAYDKEGNKYFMTTKEFDKILRLALPLVTFEAEMKVKRTWLTVKGVQYQTENKAKCEGVTVAQLKEYFVTHYSHISLELTDKELESFIKACPINRTVTSLADQLSDYILANGLGDVQE